MFIREALDIGLASDAQRTALGARTREKTLPFAVRSHIAPQSFAEQLAHGPVLARSQFLSFYQQVWRQCNRNGFCSAHGGYCKTL